MKNLINEGVKMVSEGLEIVSIRRKLKTQTQDLMEEFMQAIRQLKRESPVAAQELEDLRKKYLEEVYWSL